MLIAHIEIINKLGLHARAAAKFVTTAGAFGCDIHVINDGDPVDGKSIMGVMMLAAAKGAVLEIHFDGTDEQEALHALNTLIENRFDEGE
ncbi:MAG: HPr family phosphocarrier protein [Pseudomonadales bacterium]